MCGGVAPGSLVGMGDVQCLSVGGDGAAGGANCLKPVLALSDESPEQHAFQVLRLPSRLHDVLRAVPDQLRPVLQALLNADPQRRCVWVSM